MLSIFPELTVSPLFRESEEPDCDVEEEEQENNRPMKIDPEIMNNK